MAILNTLIASSAVALTLLAQAATPVNALAAPAHDLHARNAVSPNHNGMLKRKRTTHKNRKRCVAQQNLGNTDSNNNNNNSGSNNNNNGGNSTPPPPPPPAHNTGPACSGGKMGLAWSYDLASNYIPNAITGKVCWLYNWSSWAPDASLLGGLHFVPMFWGPNHIDDFSSNVLYNDNANYGVALAMNEVNEPSQANLDIWTGAQEWRQYMLPLRNKGYRIISPSTTSAPSGITWMQGWLGLLGDNEKPDCLAFHWYGYSFNDLQNYVNQFAAAFPGYCLWLTEFACTDFTGQGIWCDVPSFAAQAAPFLDNHPAIEAWFPFGFVGSMVGVQEENRLMNGDGSVTGVGWEYLQ